MTSEVTRTDTTRPGWQTAVIVLVVFIIATTVASFIWLGIQAIGESNGPIK